MGRQENGQGQFFYAFDLDEVVPPDHLVRQIDGLLGYLTQTRNPIRNRVILLLSVKAGLRAKEIANLTWQMVTDASGEIDNKINLQDRASKGKRSGRVIPINRDLHQALSELKSAAITSSNVIATERSAHTTPQAVVNLFAQWFRTVGLSGCSSHSGRRTFITNAARKISTVGGSLRDIQMLAGHSALSTTQRYIDSDATAQRRIVELV